MTFASARSIPQAHIRLKNGEWAKSDYLGTELDGKTLGVVGLGRVGQEVAKKLDSLGMDIVAYDPYISEERAERIGAELVEFDPCLERADVLTVHTPLTPETEGLISEPELDQLGDGYLVNCARGGVVDEDALAAKVEDGTLAGAAIDVFAEEPLPADSPLLEHDDIIVTPHLGASTEAAQENVATSTATQVNAALVGEPVANALNAPSIDESAFPASSPTSNSPKPPARSPRSCSRAASRTWKSSTRATSPARTSSSSPPARSRASSSPSSGRSTPSNAPRSPRIAASTSPSPRRDRPRTSRA